MLLAFFLVYKYYNSIQSKCKTNMEKMIMRLNILICFVLSISFFIHGSKADISFSLRDTSNGAYRKFIKALRQELTLNTNKVYGIPVLKFHSRNGTQRFLLIHLTNSANNRITLAMDVFAASIVAYRTGGESIFFKDAPEEATRVLFPQTIQNTLPYSSNYEDLENEAGTSRTNIPLGHSPLNNAINNLFNLRDPNSFPASFIVIFQIVSEAAKFKFIEQSVQNSLRDQRQTFTPSPTMLSLEDNWSELSKQIQVSLTLEGIFPGAIEIPDINGENIIVDNIGSPIVSGIALLLYQCASGVTSNGVPRFIDGKLKIVGILDYDTSCEVIVNAMKSISGRDGFCVDVKNGFDDDGTPLETWTCGDQENQKWTLADDGTIRSLGKCMTVSGNSPGNHVMIFNCDKADVPASTWILSPDGTIRNPQSGLVLTAPSAGEGVVLTLERGTKAARQGWRVGNDVLPIVTSIVGFNNMCLEAIRGNSRIHMANCVLNKKEQIWELLSDGTIRVRQDHGLCITSNGNTSPSLIVIRKCDGSSNQRWVFKTDGTILNPNSNLVMDVRKGNVDLHEIILFPFKPTDNANQQWVLLY